jgi:hypothetical protein
MGPTHTAEATKALDALERTRESLAAVSYRIERTEKGIQETTEAKGKTRKELARLRLLPENRMQAARAAKSKLATAKATVETDLLPVKSLCTGLGVQDAIYKLRSISLRPFLYAEEKGPFDEPCHALRDANKERGYRLP